MRSKKENFQQDEICYKGPTQTSVADQYKWFLATVASDVHKCFY